jgi:hypothetical protein
VLSDTNALSGTGGSFAVVDNGAASSNGLVANAHCIANTGPTPIIVKIQHSTDNVTYVDLVTFATFNSTGSEHKITTGAVNRYLKVTWSASFVGTRKIAVFAARK